MKRIVTFIFLLFTIISSFSFVNLSSTYEYENEIDNNEFYTSNFSFDQDNEYNNNLDYTHTKTISNNGYALDNIKLNKIKIRVDWEEHDVWSSNEKWSEIWEINTSSNSNAIGKHIYVGDPGVSGHYYNQDSSLNDGYLKKAFYKIWVEKNDDNYKVKIKETNRGIWNGWTSDVQNIYCESRHGGDFDKFKYELEESHYYFTAYWDGYYDFSSESNSFMQERANEASKEISQLKPYFSNQNTTYADMELYIKTYLTSSENHAQIPVGNEMNVEFYEPSDTSVLIDDKNQGLMSGQIYAKLKSSGTNKDVVGETSLLEFNVPYFNNIFLDLEENNHLHNNLDSNFIGNFYDENIKTLYANRKGKLYINEKNIKDISATDDNVKISFDEEKSEWIIDFTNISEPTKVIDFRIDYYNPINSFDDESISSKLRLNLMLDNPFFSKYDVSSDSAEVPHDIVKLPDNKLIDLYLTNNNSLILNLNNASNYSDQNNALFSNDFFQDFKVYELDENLIETDITDKITILDERKLVFSSEINVPKIFKLVVIDKLDYQYSYYFIVNGGDLIEYINSITKDPLWKKYIDILIYNEVFSDVDDFMNNVSAGDAYSINNEIANDFDDLSLYEYDNDSFSKLMGDVMYKTKIENIFPFIQESLYTDLESKGFNKDEIEINLLPSDGMSIEEYGQHELNPGDKINIELKGILYSHTFNKINISIEPNVVKDLKLLSIDNDRLSQVTNYIQDESDFNLVVKPKLENELFNQIDAQGIKYESINVDWKVRNINEINPSDEIEVYNGDIISYSITPETGEYINSKEGSFTSKVFDDLSDIELETKSLETETYTHSHGQMFGLTRPGLENIVSTQLLLRSIDSKYIQYIWSKSDDELLEHNDKLILKIKSKNSDVIKGETRIEFIAKPYYSISEIHIDTNKLNNITKRYDDGIQFKDIRNELEMEIHRQIKEVGYLDYYVKIEWSLDDDQYLFENTKLKFDIKSNNIVLLHPDETNNYEFNFKSYIPVDKNTKNILFILTSVIIIFIIFGVIILIFKVKRAKKI